jgi:segregation and condensation protein B
MESASMTNSSELPDQQIDDQQVVSEPAGDDLDAMYRRALDAIEAAEDEVGKAFNDLHEPTEDESDQSNEVADELASPAADQQVSLPVEEINSQQPRATARQIVEAALFVDGTNLTIKKIGRLLGDGFGGDRVEAIINELGEQYAAEARPYEILFGEGGYRLALRPEYERVRERAFGLGPRDVKLSQEALGVLSLIAYRQPISKPEIEKLARKNSGGLLAQLVRRELIGIERGESSGQKKRRDVKYHTTKRFLDIFGLRDIKELPQAEEIEFK